MVIQDHQEVFMADCLGILVSSDRYLDYVVRLTIAAYDKGKDVRLFFTGKGVMLTLAPQFEELVGKAKLAVCDISFRAYGLHGRESEVPDADHIEFATQATNAQMLSKADRYLVF